MRRRRSTSAPPMASGAITYHPASAGACDPEVAAFGEVVEVGLLQRVVEAGDATHQREHDIRKPLLVVADVVDGVVAEQLGELGLIGAAAVDPVALQHLDGALDVPVAGELAVPRQVARGRRERDLVPGREIHGMVETGHVEADPRRERREAHRGGSRGCHPIRRRSATERTSSTSGTITSTESRISSDLESAARPTASPIHSGKAAGDARSGRRGASWPRRSRSPSSPTAACRREPTRSGRRTRALRR